MVFTPASIAIRPLWLLLALLCASASASVTDQSTLPADKQPASITVAADEDVIEDYRHFLAGRDPRHIRDFGGPYARRDVVEIALLYQALAAGGYEGNIQLVSDKSYLRILRSTQMGNYLMSAPLVWYSDVASASDALWISEPLVREGEFVAGIYTSPKNHMALAATSQKQLHRLRAVSNKHWREDVAALKELGINQIYYSTYWVQMARMVLAGRADITLAPFQNSPDLSLDVHGQKLVPIPGVKVSLKGSRVWALSKNYPGNRELFAMLQRGLAQLNASGRVQQAYEQSGFFNPATKDWALLNPPHGSYKNPGENANKNPPSNAD